MIKNNHLFGLLFAAALSGAISALGFIKSELSVFFWVFIGPGIVYGIIVGGYFFFLYKIKNLGKYILFIIWSLISYFTAYYLHELTSGILFGMPYFEAIVLVVAGFVGSLLLLLSVHLLISPVLSKYFIFIALLGAVLSLTFFLGNIFQHVIAEDDILFAQLLCLFTLWQTGIAGAIYWVLKSNKKH